jgi:hypothetical protein
MQGMGPHIAAARTLVSHHRHRHRHRHRSSYSRLLHPFCITSPSVPDHSCTCLGAICDGLCACASIHRTPAPSQRTTVSLPHRSSRPMTLHPHSQPLFFMANSHKVTHVGSRHQESAHNQATARASTTRISRSNWLLRPFVETSASRDPNDNSMSRNRPAGVNPFQRPVPLFHRGSFSSPHAIQLTNLKERR